MLPIESLVYASFTQPLCSLPVEVRRPLLRRLILVGSMGIEFSSIMGIAIELRIFYIKPQDSLNIEFISKAESYFSKSLAFT